MRTEDRLLAVGRIYRCPPTAAASSDHDAITPVLFILGSHWSMSLARPGSRNRHQEECGYAFPDSSRTKSLHGPKGPRANGSIGRSQMMLRDVIRTCGEYW